MIRKEMFIKCMETLQKYAQAEEEISNVTKYFLNLVEFDELQNLIDCFTKLLAYCVKANYDPHVGDDLSYFIYDMDWGKKFDEFHIIREGETEPVPMRTIEELWNYFVEEHPEIVDNSKEGNDDEE